MFVEITEFHVRAGEEAAFEEAMTRALSTITAKAKGVSDYRFFRCVESPQRYFVHTTWDTIEDHMVTYRSTPEREEWRAMVTPFFAKTPLMEHFVTVTQRA